MYTHIYILYIYIICKIINIKKEIIQRKRMIKLHNKNLKLV